MRLLCALDDAGEGADQDVGHAAPLERFQRRVRVESLLGHSGTAFVLGRLLAELDYASLLA